MEYPTNEQVRKILEAEGYTAEQIEAALHAAKQVFASMIESLETLRDCLARWEEEIAPAWAEIVAQITEIAYPVPPKRRAPRPPRYAGPKNKGNPYTQQPARVARSCCRKMRR